MEPTKKIKPLLPDSSQQPPDYPKYPEPKKIDPKRIKPLKLPYTDESNDKK